MLNVVSSCEKKVGNEKEGGKRVEKSSQCFLGVSRRRWERNFLKLISISDLRQNYLSLCLSVHDTSIFSWKLNTCHLKENVINCRWELFHVPKALFSLLGIHDDRNDMFPPDIASECCSSSANEGSRGIGNMVEYCMSVCRRHSRRNITRCRDLCSFSSLSCFCLGFEFSETSKHTLVIAHHRLEVARRLSYILLFSSLFSPENFELPRCVCSFRKREKYDAWKRKAINIQRFYNSIVSTMNN